LINNHEICHEVVMNNEYDVIIMGGGPAGSTLGAILGRRTALKVGLFEKEFHPREHIGESLASTVIPILSYSGVLPKLLQSDFYSGPKPGGYYAWDPGYEDPWVVIFNQAMYDELGVLNFSMHVNRSEFDKLLLDHARDLGVDVHEGMTVIGVERIGNRTNVQFEDGSEASCKIFVEASGRRTSIMGIKRQFLSDYKNIAIWNHFLGSKPAQEAHGKWNIYRAGRSRIPGIKGEQWIPIANFAFEDGWFWYIPVPKIVMGKRTLTHSIGLVTDPRILATSPEKRYTEMDVFLARAKQIPLLCDLIAGAQPISDKVLTATNYSMISDILCNYDEGWILLGDSAFFNDPLFSNGVAFAVTGAATVSFMIEATLHSSLSEQSKRDLWYDYQQRTRTIALTISVCVDQWYHGIARKNPDSIFWQGRRGPTPDADLRHKTFYHLGNAELIGLVEYDYTGDRQRWVDTLKDLWPSLSGQQHFFKQFWKPRSPQEPTMRLKDPLDGLKASDPRRDMLRLKDRNGNELAPETIVTLHPNVAVRASVLLGQFLVRDMTPPEYWIDPLKNASIVDSVTPYYNCERFYFIDCPDEVEVPFLDEYEDGAALYSLLREAYHSYDELKQLVSSKQRSLMGRLLNAGMLLIDKPSSTTEQNNSMKIRS
jgi:flavin-dependent dehydrogenase